MQKMLIRYGGIGFLAGIAANYLLAMLLSYGLRLGYLMLYPASLPESVGGELNAALAVMLACGWLGGGIGIMIGLIRAQAQKKPVRTALTAIAFCVSVGPLFLLATETIL